MKFNNGYWKRHEGVDFKTPVEIRSFEQVGDSLFIYSSTKPVPHRGETINATLITTRISTPAPNIIQVKHFHWTGGVENGPVPKLYTQSVTPKIQIEEDRAEFTSGNTKVQIDKTNGWTMQFFHREKKLTGTTRKEMGYIIDARTGKNYMKEQLSIGVGEYIYGFGERFTNFARNGQVIDLWQEDGGTCSEQAYKNIPFYVSTGGYGVYINHLEHISVEAASEVVTGVGFSVEGEELEYCVVGGESLKEIIASYTLLTGRPALPPAWSFGLWLTPSFSIDYDESTIREFVDGMQQRDIPLRVFNFDSFYQKEYQFCDFEWDRNLFPDPQKLVDDVGAKGLKMAIWINSYIAQKSPLFAQGKEKGYFIRRTDGSVYQVDWWQPGMAIIDFTNPEAVSWYTGYLEKLMDMGIHCFKTDFGELIPDSGVIYYDGSDPKKMHNYYTYLYNKVVFEAVERHYGKGEGMVFARSATVGSQQYPIHWAGDSYSSYGSMAETLRGGLSLSMAGFGFWSHDISGFEETATPDLYKRWSAFGLLSTHSRLHGSVSFRVPWLFGEEAVDVLRYFTKLKYKLMPYLFACSCESSETGIPVMRPMLLEFEKDPVCRFLDTQYMLGGSLLVAPVMNEDGTAQYYLPSGRWTNLLSEEIYNGTKYHSGTYDYFSLPLMVRPDSIIPLGSRTDMPDYDYAKDVELHVYQLDSRASAVVYNTNGEKELELVMLKEGRNVQVSVQSVGKPYSLVFHGVQEAQYNGSVYRDEKGMLTIVPDPEEKEYFITFSR